MQQKKLEDLSMQMDEKTILKERKGMGYEDLE